MAEIRPFRGLRFDPDRAGAALGDLIAPPYDVISPEEHRHLLDIARYNIVRLEMPLDQPGGSPDYASAAGCWRTWLRDGVLRHEASPALYVHEHEFDVEGERRTRRGVFAVVRLAPWEAGVILPHERTLAKPKEQRLSLMRAVPADLSPIFGLYRDPSGAIAAALDAITRRPPDQDFTAPNGERHRLWVETDPERLRGVAGPLAEEAIFIADGHHRYETALAYQAERRSAGASGEGSQRLNASPAAEAPYDFILMSLVDMADPGLTVLPIHRVLRAAPRSAEAALAQIRERFDAEPMPLSPSGLSDALARLEAAGKSGPAMLLVLPPGDAAWLLRERAASAAGRAERRLDAVIAREDVIEGAFGVDETALEASVWFTRDAAQAVDAVRTGQAAAAILLNAVRVDQMAAEALAGRRLPQKSTYFYPKVPTGLTVYPLE